MEFFKIADTRLSEAVVRQGLTIDRLPRLCAFIDSVMDHTEAEGRIYSLWGEFRVRREAIKGGVRFSLPDCPNALAWTVTAGFPPAAEKVVIHCTINRTDHDPDFIESIEQFMADWKSGIEDMGTTMVDHGVDQVRSPVIRLGPMRGEA